MAGFESVCSLSLLAGAAFVEGDFAKLVKVTGDNTVELVDAVTDTVAGILGSAPAAIGDAVPVIELRGRGKVQAGDVIAAGELLIPAADGQVTSVADIDTIPINAMAIGIALEAAADGQIFEAILSPLVGNTSA